MRVPLRAYLDGGGAKVFSLVAALPFSPVDVDIGRLARGEWNPLTDRFRIWYLPPEDRRESPLCHVMIRKLDPKDLVLVYAHVNVTPNQCEKDPGSFTVGIMCNDDVRARLMLNTIFDIPPAFRRRSEAKLVEKRWRADPEAVMRYLANVHSATAPPDTTGRTHVMKFELPPNVKGDFRKGFEGWWEAK